VLDFDAEKHILRSPGYRSAVQQALEFFAASPVHALPPPSDPRFVGPGVYALYYTGDLQLYAEITEANKGACVRPIYVGKAVPLGWRTARTSTSETKDLLSRLMEHTDSVTQAIDLRPEDFRCRFVILNEPESDLVVPVEASVIRQYRPVWNSVVDGFGNRDPGKGRYDQAPSSWDVLHPGRYWVPRLRGTPRSREDIVARVRQVLG